MDGLVERAQSAWSRGTPELRTRLFRPLAMREWAEFQWRKLPVRKNEEYLRRATDRLREAVEDVEAELARNPSPEN